MLSHHLGDEGQRGDLAEAANADLLQECIYSTSQLGQAYVLAYAIMPDHLHLLLAPRGGQELSDVMRSLKRFTAKRVNEAKGRTGSLWQQSFYDRAIRDEAHLRQTIEYIHRNPVVAGLAKTENEYRFSSAHPDAWSDLETFLSG